MFKLWKKPAVISALIVILGIVLIVSVCTEKKLKMEALGRRCFVKKGVFKTFVKFKGKHLCQSIFFTKLQAFFYRTPPVTASVKKKKKKKIAALKLKAKSIRCYSHVFNKKARKSWMYVGLCQIPMMEFFSKINNSLLPSTTS